MTDPIKPEDNPENDRSGLGHVTFILGFGLGYLGAYLGGASPTVLGTVASIVVCADLSYYAFMGWLFKPDFVDQFKRRRRALAGTIGFKWQSKPQKFVGKI